ncbi:MAG TPA: tRNA (guanosine(46)-N7)-methyltransferase TrmB [Chthoniobacterales bacterium]|nr:tRNA (guanosine(46)-N7)-methyltransferase TrmB [Chthoniobacterales bacterium]
MIELIPNSYVARLNLEKIFGRVALLHVDLGCGDGSFLCALAELHPDENFLGIERMSGRVDKACRRARALENVRVLHLDTSYAVRYLFPESSVAVFYLLFPDPWPKRRHYRRRVVTSDFLDAIRAALVDEGLLKVATDQWDYFRQIMLLSDRNSRFACANTDNIDLPLSKFERRFRQAGAPIYRLALRKTSPVT